LAAHSNELTVLCFIILGTAVDKEKDRLEENSEEEIELRVPA
jgi:hypothetical protein